jgi:SAM-dependent methyltransferase
MAEQESVDLEAVKRGQQHVWSQGDFAVIATTQQIVGERLCETVDVFPGDRVLDVACGSGNTAIAAARRFAEVTGVDHVPALLDRARERAAAERLEMEFVDGDAEALPFDDGTFDCVLSTFGAMFAPAQERAAGELLRVCRPGGRIGMANWTPDGFVGQMFKTTMSHLSPGGPPPGVKPPPLWGTEGFGPTRVAFESLGENGDALGADLLGLARRSSRGGERAMIVPSEYVEVLATRA